MVSRIDKCRICKSTHLNDFLNLGSQALTGVFPEQKSQKETYGELVLTKCNDCHLVQLRHSAPINEMYGENYGYRSGLNKSMVEHLKKSVEDILKIVKFDKDDLVIDVGSNDGTLLGFYPSEGLNLVGVDPVGTKFIQYYKPHVKLIPDFFPSEKLTKDYNDKKAKVITSFSCFYDLEDPVAFVRAVKEHLHKDGVWVFEQSYLPLMVSNLSYDTVCHEHLEYYSLTQIVHMLKTCKLKAIDVTFNDVNGGSFCVTAAHEDSNFKANNELIEKILNQENAIGLKTDAYYIKFAKDVAEHRVELLKLLNDLKKQGKTIAALGASTKGNVVLQYCDLTSSLINCVGEVNPYKFSRFTPGTKIPIVSEEELETVKPDYKMILPWHFRSTFIEKESKFVAAGGKLIFPLPIIEVYPK